jgi:hypothetical protein
MSKPFFTRLHDYFESVGKVMSGEATVASVFANPSDVGTSRERVYAEVLRQHLPSSCNVFLGGFLFGADGAESKQIDIVVTTDKALQFNFHNATGGGKAFASVDGCIGVVSIKSHLTSTALRDALANLASVPQQLRSEGRVNPNYRFNDYDDWPYKVIYATSGVESSAALAAVTEFYEDHPEISENRRPHIIHVANSYVICRARETIRTRDGLLVKGTFGVVSRDPDVQALLLVIKNLQQNVQNASQVIFNYRHILERTFAEESDGA